MTTLWNESLYKAWSIIIQHILPDVGFFNTSLKKISKIIDSDEIFLMEKYTLLKIASYNKSQKAENILHYEKLSLIIKKFKISISWEGKETLSLNIVDDKFSLIFQPFTENTMILVVFYNRKANLNMALLNITLAQRYIEKQKSNENQILKSKW